MRFKKHILFRATEKNKSTSCWSFGSLCPSNHSAHSSTMHRMVGRTQQTKIRRTIVNLFFTVALILGCLLVPVSVYAVSVKATVDKNRMTLEDILTLTVSVSDSDARVDMSVIKDFRILSQSTGSSIQWINGKTSHEYTHAYSLSPLRKGRLTIPSLILTDRGKSYHTQPITILVQDAPENQDIFVKAKVNDLFPYVGEQIIYEFTLYFAARISNPSLNMPDFNDFMLKETGKDTSFTTLINGREYQGIERRYLLIPLKAGKYNIPPSVLSCEKVLQNRGRSNDPFDRFASPFFGRTRTERKVLRTNPLTIDVSPLPLNSFDVPFSGLVGQVDFSGKIENDHLKVGDSTTLTLTVEGSGNIMDVEEPKVLVPDGLKMYKDNPEEDISIKEKGYQGKKIFRVALVAVKEGEYTVPSVKINVFDVEKGQYELLSTPDMTIFVAPSDQLDRQAIIGPEPSDDAGDKQLRIKKKKVEYTGHDILPLKESLSGVTNKPGLSLMLFTILLVIPAFAAGLVKAVLIYSGRGQSRAALMVKRAEEALKAAGASGLSDEEFLSGLYRAFASMVFSKASQKGETLTTSEVETILGNAGINSDCIAEARILLDRLESTRYSGQTLNDASKKELIDKTRQMIRRLKS